MQKGTYLSILLQHFGLDKMPLHAAKQIGCFIDMNGYPGCSQAEETVVMRFTLVIRQPETMQLSQYTINLVQFILQPQYTLEYICEGVIQIRTSKLQ